MVDADRVQGAGRPLGPVDRTTAAPTPRPASQDSGSFDAVLRETLRHRVRFSAHAQDRLRAREITLTPDAAQRLERAVSAAEAKAARDALVLLDGLGLVVNVPNRVVVTALDPDATTETVITNIDSAVIAARRSASAGENTGQ